MFWPRGVISVQIDFLPFDGLPSGSFGVSPSPFLFPLSSFIQTSLSVPVQKWKLLTRQHATLNIKQEDTMTDISNVESRKRTRVATIWPWKWKEPQTSRASQGFLFSLSGQAAAWSLAGTACWCLQSQKPVILKDIRFLENTLVYLWRTREGFPTQSEALG